MVASQKLTRLMASCIDMPGEGLVGLHVGAFDASVTVCNTEEGGRVPFIWTKMTSTCKKMHMLFAPTSSNSWAVCYFFLFSFTNKLACFPMLNLILSI
jgi:hypothetical protein